MTTKNESSVQRQDIPIERKDIRQDDIVLSRHSVSPLAYFMMVVFFVLTAFATKTLDVAWYFNGGLFQGQANQLSFAILTFFTILLAIILIFQARQHSKRYNDDILAVFEYMQRQNASRFWYSTRNEKSYGQLNVVELQEVLDVSENSENKEGTLIEVQPVLDLEGISKDWPRAKPYTLNINDIEEIGIGNQAEGFNGERYLPKNPKIRKMLRSDKIQLFLFVGAYATIIAAGVFVVLAV